MARVKRTTRKLDKTTTIIFDYYKNIRPKTMKMMINRYFNKMGEGGKLYRGSTGVLYPSMGLEIQRLSHRGVLVMRMVGDYNPNPSIDSLIKRGVTHLYQKDTEMWIPLWKL